MSDAVALVQYVVVRGDLQRALRWTPGAVLAQACHACTAAIHNFYHDPHTQQYLQRLDSMHKVVLEVPDEQSLTSLSQRLSSEQIDHWLWVERPENVATCLALKPCPRERVRGLLRDLKLLR
uniref:peptidyl-tRNA hydrolase n=1 Tax=Callorhinchus milii TaxID=7868 RepID=V9LK56_CALMI